MVGVSKTDSGYAWTVVIIKLGCVPGKGVIELLMVEIKRLAAIELSIQTDFYRVCMPISGCTMDDLIEEILAELPDQAPEGQ